MNSRKRLSVVWHDAAFFGVVLLVVAACSAPTPAVTPEPRALPDGIVKFHDASAEVTCWASITSIDRYYTGLSCLPDQWLPAARAAGGE